PRRLVGEVLGLVGCKLADHRAGERAALHIGERLGADHVITVAGTQEFQEIEPALRAGRSEPGEAVVADLRAEAVLRLVASPGVVDGDPRGGGKSGTQYVLRLGPEMVLAIDQKPHH